MLAVHRQQLYTMLCHSLCDQMTAGDKALLVGKGQIMAAFNGAQAGAQTRNAHHAVQHHIGAVQCGQLLEPSGPTSSRGASARPESSASSLRAASGSVMQT